MSSFQEAVAAQPPITFEPIPGTTVIGLGHKARHGKDTAAAAIIAAIPGAMRFSFADDLYAVARVLYGMTTKDAPLLQRIGVDYRDVKGPDVWVKAVYAKILDAKPRLAIITDVRFPNEMAFVKALGGATVKVTRLTADCREPYVDPSRPATHISECALDGANWDLHLTARDGDVPSLQRAAVQWAQFFLDKQEPKAA